MRKIGIRDMRAEALREFAEEGDPVAITDNRELVGIFCPVTRDWLTHVLNMNASRLEQTLPQGEKQLANHGEQLATLDDVEARATTSHDSGSGWIPNPFQVVSGALTAVMGRTRPDLVERPKPKTVGMADLKTGKAIREAAQHQQILAVTDRRELIGMIVPVGESFLSRVLEANMSRIYKNIIKGTQELRAGQGRSLDDFESLPSSEPLEAATRKGGKASASVVDTPTAQSPAEILSMKEVAERLGVAPSTVRRYIANGLLPEPAWTSRGRSRQHQYDLDWVTRAEQLLRDHRRHGEALTTSSAGRSLAGHLAGKTLRGTDAHTKVDSPRRTVEVVVTYAGADRAFANQLIRPLRQRLAVDPRFEVNWSLSDAGAETETRGRKAMDHAAEAADVVLFMATPRLFQVAKMRKDKLPLGRLSASSSALAVGLSRKSAEGAVDDSAADALPIFTYRGSWFGDVAGDDKAVFVDELAAKVITVIERRGSVS